MKTKRINLISGPRNISTALMYSFANREDTVVIDEPMYAHYLLTTGIDYHPGKAEVLHALPHDMDTVKKELIFQPITKPIYFIKGMAHHYVDVDFEFLLELDNLFLIRDPYQLITSFSKVVPNPTMLDIGLEKEWEICMFLMDNNRKPLVLNSNTILDNPRNKLNQLCERLNIPFSDKMLRWEEGPKKEDGVWAKYWYHNTWKSTTFVQQKSSSDKLPGRLKDLYDKSVEYYKLLQQFEL